VNEEALAHWGLSRKKKRHFCIKSIGDCRSLVTHIFNSTTDLQIVNNRKTELQIHKQISLIKVLDNMFAKMNPDFIA